MNYGDISTSFKDRKMGEIRKLKKYNELVGKYKGTSKVMEELMQRLQVKASTLKRYEQRIEQYRVNRMYQQDQKRVYQEMSGKQGGEKVIPDAEKSVRFWSGNWNNDIHHNSKADVYVILKTSNKSSTFHLLSDPKVNSFCL